MENVQLPVPNTGSFEETKRAVDSSFPITIVWMYEAKTSNLIFMLCH